MFWIGILLGGFAGGVIGIVVTALMVAAGRDQNQEY